MSNLVKKCLSVLLVVLFVSTALVSCVDSPDVDESIASDADVSADTSIGQNSDSSDVVEESQEESIPPEDTVVSFLACPDNIIHPSVFYDAIERAAVKNNVKPDYSDLHNATYDFTQIYEYVDDAMAAADVCYINQETLVGGTSGKIIGYPCFNSPKPVADTVIDIGVDVVNVAHNHMLDSGNTKYIENCYNVFESEGVEVIGYYPDQASTENITVINSNGIKIAFLAYTYSTNGIPLPAGSPAVIPYFSEELINKQVMLAKQVADIIIVSCHWGIEDSFDTSGDQRKYAKLMCELGVDVVLGMHPHVIQPMEWMTSETGSKTLVVYSLGNFVSGMIAGKNMLAGMLSLDIVKNGVTGEITIESPTFIPTVTHYEQKNAVAGNDTGFRDFKIYYLENYTDELASKHGNRKSQLVGGAFNMENLVKTLNTYIPDEFLPEKFHKKTETAN